MSCLRVFFGMPYMIRNEVLIAWGVCSTVLYAAGPTLTARCRTICVLLLCAIGRGIQTVAPRPRNGAFGKLHDAIMDDWHGPRAGTNRVRSRTATLVACYSCGVVSNRSGAVGLSALAESVCTECSTESARWLKLGRLVRRLTWLLSARSSLADGLRGSIP